MSVAASDPSPPPSPELRVYLLVRDLQRQFAAYLATPTRARGYPPFEGNHALIVEVAPGLAIERVTDLGRRVAQTVSQRMGRTILELGGNNGIVVMNDANFDLALRAVPSVEPGILFVERQFGVLEIHGTDLAEVERAGQAILDGLHADAADQLRPRTLYSDVIEAVTDQHAVIINRNRQASMILPGETLLVYEMTPALFAAVDGDDALADGVGGELVDGEVEPLARREAAARRATSPLSTCR